MVCPYENASNDRKNFLLVFCIVDITPLFNAAFAKGSCEPTLGVPWLGNTSAALL